MTKDASGHTLTKKQEIQLAEVEAAKSSASNTPVDPSAGGSDANSGPAKDAAPVSGDTPAGSGNTTTPARVPTTGRTTSTP